MDFLVFAVVVFATFFNAGLQWYTQVATYPLFSWVGQGEFVAFHKEYERRLPFSIYGPYAVMMASTFLLLFVRPEGVDLGWILTLLVLGALIAVVSIAFAAPVHYEMDRRGRRTTEGVRKLLFFNGVRLAVSALGSAIVLYLLINLPSS